MLENLSNLSPIEIKFIVGFMILVTAILWADKAGKNNLDRKG